MRKTQSFYRLSLRIKIIWKWKFEYDDTKEVNDMIERGAYFNIIELGSSYLLASNILYNWNSTTT